MLCSERFKFSIVGLEQMPVHLREHILNFQLRVSSEQLHVSVDYILASGHEALVGTMSWMEVFRMQAQDMLSPAQAADQFSIRHSVQCFCGPAGSGKTHSMRAKAANQAAEPETRTVSESTTTADIISCLSKAASTQPTAPHVQLFISSYADFPWLNQLLYQLLVEGSVTDLMQGLAFSFLPEATAIIDIEVPEAVSGEVQQETLPPFARSYPALSSPQHGMLLHLPILADLVGSSNQAWSMLHLVDPNSE